MRAETVLTAVLAAIINAVPEKARSAVLKALKGISSNNTSATRVLFSGIVGLPKHTQDDLEQCCVVGELTKPGAPYELTAR